MIFLPVYRINVEHSEASRFYEMNKNVKHYEKIDFDELIAESLDLIYTNSDNISDLVQSILMTNKYPKSKLILLNSDLPELAEYKQIALTESKKSIHFPENNFIQMGVQCANVVLMIWDLDRIYSLNNNMPVYTNYNYWRKYRIDIKTKETIDFSY